MIPENNKDVYLFKFNSSAVNAIVVAMQSPSVLLISLTIISIIYINNKPDKTSHLCQTVMYI